MTDQDLLTDLQYALVEPPDGGASFLSELWTRDEVLHAVTTRLRQLHRDTQIIAKYGAVPVGPSENPIDLPADWIATLEIVWRTPANVRRLLRPSDAYEADLLSPNWETTPAIPSAYLDGDDGTRTIRLAPLPAAEGVVEILYVAQPTTVTGEGTNLLTPDEFLDGVKYGALADLLGKVGRASDVERSQYAEERYQLTVAMSELILGGWA